AASAPSKPDAVVQIQGRVPLGINALIRPSPTPGFPFLGRSSPNGRPGGRAPSPAEREKAGRTKAVAGSRQLRAHEPGVPMNYTPQFGIVFAQLPYLLGGALVTLEMAFIIFWGAFVIGLFGAMGKTFGGPITKRAVNAYVAFFTNTPAFVQVFFLFNGLP